MNRQIENVDELTYIFHKKYPHIDVLYYIIRILLNIHSKRLTSEVKHKSREHKSQSGIATLRTNTKRKQSYIHP